VSCSADCFPLSLGCNGLTEYSVYCKLNALLNHSVIVCRGVEVWPYASSVYPQCKIQMLDHTVNVNVVKGKHFARNWTLILQTVARQRGVV